MSNHTKRIQLYDGPNLAGRHHDWWVDPKYIEIRALPVIWNNSKYDVTSVNIEYNNQIVVLIDTAGTWRPATASFVPSQTNKGALVLTKPTMDLRIPEFGWNTPLNFNDLKGIALATMLDKVPGYQSKISTIEATPNITSDSEDFTVDIKWHDIRNDSTIKWKYTAEVLGTGSGLDSQLNLANTWEAVVRKAVIYNYKLEYSINGTTWKVGYLGVNASFKHSGFDLKRKSKDYKIYYSIKPLFFNKLHSQEGEATKIEINIPKLVVTPGSPGSSVGSSSEVSNIISLSLQNVDISDMIQRNKPNINIGKSYSSLISNKNNINELNKEIIKKIEIISINLIYFGNTDYNNLKVENNLFRLDDGKYYTGNYHFKKSDNKFMTESTHTKNSEELTFIYLHSSEYSSIESLRNASNQLVQLNNQLNTGINTISFEMSKYLNFIVGFERSLFNFYGFNDETKKDSIKNLLDSNLSLQKYRGDVNWETLITKFDLAELSKNTIGNIYFDFYNNYKNLLNTILKSIPSEDTRKKFISTSQKYSGGNNKLYMLDANGKVEQLYNSINESIYSTFFDFGVSILNSPGITKFKNLLSIISGTYDYDTTIDNLDENYAKVVAFDFSISKFLKVFKDLIDKQNNSSLEIYPLEYLISIVKNSNPNKESVYDIALRGFEQLNAKFKEVLSTGTENLNDTYKKELKVYSELNKLSGSKLQFILEELEQTSGLMLANFKNIYSIINSLKSATFYDEADVKIKEYIKKISDYKWYNDTELKNITYISGNPIAMFDVVKKIDELNWPSSKFIKTAPEYYLAPMVLYTNVTSPSRGEKRRHIRVDMSIYIPPFGIDITKIVFAAIRPAPDVLAKLKEDIYIWNEDGLGDGQDYVMAEPDGRSLYGGLNPTPNIYMKDTSGNNKISIPYIEYNSGLFEIHDVKAGDQRPIVNYGSGRYIMGSYILIECKKSGSSEKIKILTITDDIQWT